MRIAAMPVAEFRGVSVRKLLRVVWWVLRNRSHLIGHRGMLSVVSGTSPSMDPTNHGPVP
jgi:hypothetical protein